MQQSDTDMADALEETLRLKIGHATAHRSKKTLSSQAQVHRHHHNRQLGTLLAQLMPLKTLACWASLLTLPSRLSHQGKS